MQLTEMLPYYGVLITQLQQSQESIDEELDVAKASGVKYKSEGWNSRARNPEGLHFELSVLDSSHSSYFKACSCCTRTYSTEPEQRLELLSVVYVKLGVPYISLQFSCCLFATNFHKIKLQYSS